MGQFHALSLSCVNYGMVSYNVTSAERVDANLGVGASSDVSERPCLQSFSYERLRTSARISASLRAVPLGESFFCRWCISHL